MPALPDQRLQQELAAVTQPDIHAPFKGTQDVFSRLAPYHLLHSAHAQQTPASNAAELRAVEEALDNFQKRFKKEGAVDHMRLVSEQAFLEGLWAQQEQMAKQGVVQSALTAAAIQVRQPAATSAAPAASVHPPAPLHAAQPIPGQPQSSNPSPGSTHPAGSSLTSLAENQSGWVQVNNNSAPTGAMLSTNPQSVPSNTNS